MNAAPSDGAKDPREAAVETLLAVRALLAQVEPDPETPAGAAIEQSLSRIAETLGLMPESATQQRGLL